jgi:hypothetical protein
MHAERIAQIQAEESSCRPPIWTEVYQTMRCPGPPCTLGTHCFIDLEDGKKHIKLNTHHLHYLIKEVEAGFELRSQHHIPDDLRSQLHQLQLALGRGQRRHQFECQRP